MNDVNNLEPGERIVHPDITRMSIDELRHTILRVVDQLRRFQAQIVETHARFDGALGLIATLRAENAELKELLSELNGQNR